MYGLIFLLLHLIGAIITLIIFCKNGTMKDAALNGDGFETSTPSDIVFMAFVVWEIMFVFYTRVSIVEAIDNYFREKYRGEDNDNENGRIL